MYRYCGRTWDSDDLERMRALIRSRPFATRADLSRLVCELFEWRKLDGNVKEMSCRVAMLRMHGDGLIQLPAPRRRAPGTYQVVASAESDPGTEVACSVEDLRDVHVEVVERGAALRLWNQFIRVARYGYQPVLMETFVETARFPGTCYKAAGWTTVGCTQGRGKLDRSHNHAKPVKSVWLKPLIHDFRECLQGRQSS